MTEERDPMLQRLFADADVQLDAEQFVTGVMARTRVLRYRRMATIGGMILVFGVLAWLLALPLQELAQLLSQLLATTLVDLGEGWLTFLLAPINNVASVVIIGGKLIRMAWKRIVSASYVN